MLVSVFTSWNTENKRTYNFCVMNKINMVWFYLLYRNYIFEQICDLFLHFKNIFYYVTLENIFRVLNNSVYFQNIVLCNKLFMDLYSLNKILNNFTRFFSTCCYKNREKRTRLIVRHFYVAYKMVGSIIIILGSGKLLICNMTPFKWSMEK